jgi:hypothetical protein
MAINNDCRVFWALQSQSGNFGNSDQFDTVQCPKDLILNRTSWILQSKVYRTSFVPRRERMGKEGYYSSVG